MPNRPIGAHSASADWSLRGDYWRLVTGITVPMAQGFPSSYGNMDPDCRGLPWDPRGCILDRLPGDADATLEVARLQGTTSLGASP